MQQTQIQQRISSGLCLVTLPDFGDNALVVNGQIVATSDPDYEKPAYLEGLAERLASALQVGLQVIHTRTDDAEWTWDDIIDDIGVKSIVPEVKGSIRAEVHADDRVMEATFNAAAWFLAATADDIAALKNVGWRGDDLADKVAEFVADSEPDVKAVFDYVHLTQQTRNQQGFECSVDPIEAMEWLKTYRPGVVAIILCEDNDVSVVEAQEEEIRGRWDWLDREGNASDASLETREDAALDAVRVLRLDS